MGFLLLGFISGNDLCCYKGWGRTYVVNDAEPVEYILKEEIKMKNAIYGDWVEIEEVILIAIERAPRLPEDTKKTNLMQWIRGNLLTEKATIGDEVEIETVIGRKVKGKLSDIHPRHVHDFGDHVKELLDVGKELKKEMEML
jgi:hypothetical protein